MCTCFVCLYVCLSVDLEVFCINFKVFDSTMFCGVYVLSCSHFSGEIHLFTMNLVSTGTTVCDMF